MGLFLFYEDAVNVKFMQMNSFKFSIFLVLVGTLGFSIAWMARGLYDQLFLLEGHCHVVNHSVKDIEVRVGFPSGKFYDQKIPPLGNVDFIVKDSGEGPVEVTVNGTIVKKVGYVTSMNNVVVLSISPENVTFSQIFPGWKGYRNKRI